MDNSKRSIHNSGPLSILMKSGQIKKISDEDNNVELEVSSLMSSKPQVSSYFKTQSGIEFVEQELIYIDPKECEPWKYANRQDDELGDIDDLIDSIKRNKQLQPALVRKHPAPHDNIKYEIIFGKRRHFACLQLSIPFLAICKDIPNVQDAIASQDAENKLRNDVSNYSNAMLYKRLLEDSVFKTEKELAEKLRISSSSFNDLMSFTRIPTDIVLKIPNIHGLSKNLALKLVSVLNASEENHKKILTIAHDLGDSITSTTKLEQALKNGVIKESKTKVDAKLYQSKTGKKLFTAKIDQRGNHCVVFKTDITNSIDIEELYMAIKNHLEKRLSNPDIRIDA